MLILAWYIWVFPNLFSVWIDLYKRKHKLSLPALPGSKCVSFSAPPINSWPKIDHPPPAPIPSSNSWNPKRIYTHIYIYNCFLVKILGLWSIRALNFNNIEPTPSYMGIRNRILTQKVNLLCIYFYVLNLSTCGIWFYVLNLSTCV